MKDAVKEINDARARGVKITADQYPYNQSAPIGSITSFIRVPRDMEPMAGLRKKMRDRSLDDTERAELGRQYMDELKKALADKTKRAQIKKMTVEGLPRRETSDLGRCCKEDDIASGFISSNEGSRAVGRGIQGRCRYFQSRNNQG